MCQKKETCQADQGSERMEFCLPRRPEDGKEGEDPKVGTGSTASLGILDSFHACRPRCMSGCPSFLGGFLEACCFLGGSGRKQEGLCSSGGPPLPRGCPDPACHVPLARLAPYSAGPGSVLGVSKGQRQPSVLLPGARCGAADVRSTGSFLTQGAPTWRNVVGQRGWKLPV